MRSFRLGRRFAAQEDGMLDIKIDEAAGSTVTAIVCLLAILIPIASI